MENETRKEPEIITDGAPMSPENVEPSAPQTPETPEDFDLMQLLGEPTEPKPEHWEQQEIVNENLPGFDPPEQQPELLPAETIIIDPDGRSKKAFRKVDHSENTFIAAIAIEIVDEIVPSVADRFWLKTGDHEQFKATPDAKHKASVAVADYLGDANVEVSPFWKMMFAIGNMYTPLVVAGLQLQAERKKNVQQQAELDEERRQRLEAERLHREEKERNLEDRRKVAELELVVEKLNESVAKTKLKAKETSEKVAKKPAKKPTVKPKKTDVEN